MSNGAMILDVTRRLLREEWDPIGVNEIPGAEDEYDCYAPQVVNLYFAGKRKEIFDYLYSTEAEAMGLPPRPERTRKFVAFLLEQLDSLP